MIMLLQGIHPQLLCLPSVHIGGYMLVYLCLLWLTLTQCWANVGPPSTMLSQHQPSIGLPCRVWRHAEYGPALQTVGQH